ncbi:MAG TPA: HD domain-containing phosphohydrolase [Acidothermaceae bacterium]|nr:HD domain-containing phosphohydrolase [Acidothermaceae bacterium]
MYGDPARPHVRWASGGFPISGQPLRLGEFIATFALAQDNAFGQPLESQLRSCLLASAMCEDAGFSAQLCETVYWVALLRYIGCTGHAHEVATLFGDEIAIRGQTLVHDAANPAEVMRDVFAYATAGHTPEEQEHIVEAIKAGAHDWAVHNFASGCEVGDMLVRRLDMGDDVRDALRFTFERWNGNGFPAGASGADIPLAMRVVHLSHDMEALARHFSPEHALDAVRERRDRTYDPELADLFSTNGAGYFERLGKADPWDAVLSLEPRPRRILEGADLDHALEVAADFIDLKSPYMAGHSRRCAQLSADAAAHLGCSDDEITTLRRAALVHEFGTTAISNSILDKSSALTRAEFDRVEVHPMLTEQMLRRTPALAALNSVAAAHHEKANGSGYHKRVRSESVSTCGQVLATTDIYVGLTTDRADRPAFSGDSAAAELRRMVASGVLDKRTTSAVLDAAGHGDRNGFSAAAPKNVHGLTPREVEVLRLAARGLTTGEIATQLFISPKTADHHIQHVYGKIGVSSRAGAMLWAIQNSVVA